MRAIRILNDGIKTCEKPYKSIVCPYTFKAGTDACAVCATNCAWFKVIENYGSPVTKNVCFCGDKVIGRLE